MALSSKSLIVYGLTVTTLNQNFDFKITALGDTLTAQIPLGFYSPAGLADALRIAIQNSDPTNIYTVTVDRTVMGGAQNRFAVITSGTFLSILFATGPNFTISCAELIGFNPVDYTGATTYTGSTSTGTVLIPTFVAGFNFSDDFNRAKVFGSVNVSAGGIKESVTWNIQKFIEVNFLYEPKSRLSEWKEFFYWAIQQKPFDFTPQISDPSTYYQVTLDKTEEDTQGLSYRMPEMLPALPNFYQTGLLTMRIIDGGFSFI